MELTKSKLNRRIGVILNFACIILIVAFFELIKLGTFSKDFILIEIIPVILLITLYVIYFGKTGLWKFTHKSVSSLDEREIQLTNQALRFSYTLFTIISLSLFIIYNVLGLNINMVLIVSLIYLAHILPSYFISWTENITRIEE